MTQVTVDGSQTTDPEAGRWHARIHDLSISLDGFATGEGQRAEAPMGHADGRLHEWMIATRFGAPIVGAAGGSEGTDYAIAHQRSRQPIPAAASVRVPWQQRLERARERKGGHVRRRKVNVDTDN
jgi:hypothetical protein